MLAGSGARRRVSGGVCQQTWGGTPLKRGVARLRQEVPPGGWFMLTLFWSWFLFLLAFGKPTFHVSCVAASPREPGTKVNWNLFGP